MSEIQDKITAARAQLAQLAQEREARAQIEAEAFELAEVERELRNAQVVADAEKAHGPLARRDADGNLVGGTIARFDTERGAVIVRKPSHLIFRRFSDAGKLNTDTCLQLIKPSLVHPSKDAFEDWIEDLPGIVLPLANLVSSLAGVRSTETTGK